MSKDPARELPADIYSVESVRAIDRAAIDGAGISGYALMTRAAQAALDCARARYPDARRWQIVCGGGNNAGDGYVLARLAAQQGLAVSVIALVDVESLSGDALSACMDFAAEGGVLAAWQGELDGEADLLVDALLGSGLVRDVAGDFAAAVGAINAHAAPVLALDIPTGINGDSGAVMGTAVKADLTITFVGLKSGLFVGEGPNFSGDLCFNGLGIAAECRAGIEPAMRRIELSILRQALPPRRRTAHKGDFGHVVVVGGGPGMPGAVRLAGEAALRAGAGRVSIATHPSHHAAIAAGRPELMCHAIDVPGDISALLDDASVVALGPGLGRTDWAVALFEAVVEKEIPLVIDADGLNLLAGHPRKRADWILTPHPGEAARLLGETGAGIQADRPAALSRLETRYGGTIVLKGSGSLVSGEGGVPWLCTSGNPGMAAPGMGDVLTGIVAALRAQGLGAALAAAAGVEIHARAGDTAAAGGQRGMLAGDLMGAIRGWANP